MDKELEDAKEAVLVPSEELTKHDLNEVKGYDFNKGIDYARIMESYLTTGFQATHFGKAVEVRRSYLCCTYLCF